MPAILGIIGLAITGAATGYSLSGAGQVQQPNLGASSKQMSNTLAELLPIERALQAAAEEGGTTLLPGYKQTTSTDLMKTKLDQQLAQLQNQLASAQQESTQAGAKGAGGIGANIKNLQNKIADVQGQISNLGTAGSTVYVDKTGKVVPASQAMANFAGYSQADIQGAIAQQLAQGQLDLSQKYDPQFIASALSQEAQADPQSVAARKDLYNLIQQQIANPPQSPVSQEMEMESQIQNRVNAGEGLTSSEQALLDQAVASSNADRGGSAPADFSADLTTGMAGEQRALANAAAGQGWLGSGETPQDIAYRAEQQNLANLGNFISGQTPQAQFKELSGAQQGPTPVTTGGAPALATLPSNAGQLGVQGALSQYQAQANQPNTWMSGLSSLLSGLNAAGNAGWSPFGG